MVNDLVSTNSDCLAVVTKQYGDALRDRADAWLQASTLPHSVKAEIGKLDLAVPSDSPKPLSLLGSEATTLCRIS